MDSAALSGQCTLPTWRSTISTLSRSHSDLIEGPKSISSHEPDEAPGSRFFYPNGGKRPSHASGSSFSPGFGPSSIRRAQAIPGPPGRARGLRTREKWGRACSVGKRHPEPYYLVANPPLPLLVALPPPAPPLANPPAGCLNSAVTPPTSLYSDVRRAV
jgi:hypothetical protein